MEELSIRGTSNLTNIVSKIPKSILEPHTEPNDIDLSFAENWLIRKEVLDILKVTFRDQLQAHHLDWAHGFHGDPHFLLALAKLFNDYFKPHVPVEAQHIAIAPGAGACLDALFYNICDPGDGVLVPCPFWNGYGPFLGARSSVVPIGVEVLDLEASMGSALIPALEQALKASSRPIKAVLLSNPHNPIGKLYSREILQECLLFCQRHRVHLVSDEVFALSEFGCNDLRGPRSFVSALSLDATSLGCDPDRVHTIWSMSKDLSATGIRMGSVVTRNSKLRSAISLITTANLSTLSVLCAKEILLSVDLHSLLQLSCMRLNEAYSTLVLFFNENSIVYIPSQASMFVMAKLAPAARTPEAELRAMAQYKAAGVLLSPAFIYQTPLPYRGWARISFAIDREKMETAVKRMQPVYQSLAE